MVPELDAANGTRMLIGTKNDDNSPPIPREDVIKLSYPLIKATRREGMVQDKTSMVNIVKMVMIKARQKKTSPNSVHPGPKSDDNKTKVCC